MYETFRADTQALSDAEGFGSQPVVTPGVRTLFNVLANAWLWAVLGLSLTSLVVVPRCRGATPIWGLAGLQVLAVVPGLALQRYHHSIVPLLAILAAGLLAAIPNRGRTVSGASGGPTGAPDSAASRPAL